MFKVLIADDEPFILEGLMAAIPWEDFDLLVVNTIMTGRAALEILLAEEIDILITDIRMPEINGIELIQEIRQRKLPVKCIVLSGYSDFNYVKETAKLGIENYLLKPINLDECFSTLSGVVEKLEEEKLQQSIYSEGMEILQDNVILRWMSGEIEEEELRERSELLSINLQGGFVSVVIQQTKWDQLFFITCKNLMESERRGFAVRQSGNRIYLLFHGHVSEPGSVQAFLEMLRNKKPDINISAGEWQDSFLNVYKSTVQANSEPYSIESEQPVVKYSDSIQKLVSYIKENYNQEINLKTIAAEFNMNPFYLGQLFKNEMGEHFTHYLNKLRIEKAKSLLHHHLTTKEVSTIVGYLSANYFCTMFKKYEGMSPQDYLEQAGKKEM